MDLGVFLDVLPRRRQHSSGVSNLPLAVPAALPAVGVAFASACGFAFSTSLQHRVAGAAPGPVRGTAQLLRYVSTKPLWVLGITAGAAALALHALALRLGAIALVQPLMLAGVVLAVPVRAALDRRAPSGPELRAVSTAAVGLALFLLAADPHGTGAPPDGRAALVLTLAGLLAAAGTAACTPRLGRANSRAILLGTTGGILFGLTAGLLKLIVTDLDPGRLGATLAGWPLWALLCVGGCGMAVNQRAYQIAPLSVSMPMVNIVNVMVALAFGRVVLGETVAHDPLALVAQAVGLTCMAVGMRLVARTSPTPTPATHPARGGRP